MVFRQNEHVFSRGNDVELILFDECSGEVYYNQLKELESPVVVLVNLARIAFDEEGKEVVGLFLLFNYVLFPKVFRFILFSTYD